MNRQDYISGLFQRPLFIEALIGSRWLHPDGESIYIVGNKSLTLYTMWREDGMEGVPVYEKELREHFKPL